MAIPDTQLDTWTHLGSVQQSSETYQSIKKTLEQSDAPYSSRSVDAFLQGSYGNDTNIFGDSDVDLVLRTKVLFYYNIDALSETEKAAFKRDHPNQSQFDLPDFRKEVISWLGAQYGSDLDASGKKALRLKARNNRRSADILLVCPHKRYSRYMGLNDQAFVEGVIFRTNDGKTIINYPKQHSEHLTKKHQTTSEWLKPTARIYKNMRNRMLEKGLIKAGTAPSYFLEGALYNVPPEHFGGGWTRTVEKTFEWIDRNDPSKYTCANGVHPLVSELASTSWPVQSYIDWLEGMKKLWNGWR